MPSIPNTSCPICGKTKSYRAKTCWPCMDKRSPASFCPQCGKPKTTKAKTCLACMGHHGPLARSFGDYIADPISKQRFLQRTTKADDGCWMWTGQINVQNGYGTFSLGKAQYYAHRIAYQLFRGSVPKGMMVLHRCDIRACVCPTHLFLGDSRANLEDAAAKGRINTQKLTAEDVQQIRERYALGGITQKELAAMFGVGQSQIARIVLRQTWRFVP